MDRKILVTVEYIRMLIPLALPGTSAKDFVRAALLENRYTFLLKKLLALGDQFLRHRFESRAFRDPTSGKGQTDTSAELQELVC